MTSQAQGKGKKKNKEVMKVSLDEFNQIDAPHGHSVVSLKMTGLDWAATMADYDQQATEIQQIIVPTAPRAQRGPGVDFDSLPNEPPFRVSIFNLPMSMEEKEIQERFFQGLEVVRVDITKSSTTVELGSKQNLYDALCKDGTSVKGRVINVCLFGRTPQNTYGGRGGNSSYGDRNQGGFGGQRMGDRYGGRESDSHSGFKRDGFGQNRDGFGQSRDGFGQSRGGFGQQRNSFGERYRSQFTSGGGEPDSEEPTNWRSRPTPPAPLSYNNGSRHQSRLQPSQHLNQQPSPAPSHQQQYHQPPEPHYQPRYQPPNPQPYSQRTEERPKLNLTKRKTPLNPEDLTAVSRNEAIFGKAKPSSTPYEKMKEVEEKLQAVQLDDKPRK